MNNLTTRKIVLGLLMVFVLAFSMQGIAEALTLSPRTSPGDHSTLTEGAPITVSGISGRPNNATQMETVTITANGGGVIEDYPSDGWSEIGGDLGGDPPTNGTITIPSSVKITFPSQGMVTVTVGWIPTEGSTIEEKVFTFYVVPDSKPTALDASFDTPGSTIGYHSTTSTEQISPDDAGLLANDTVSDLPLRYSVSGGTL